MKELEKKRDHPERVASDPVSNLPSDHSAPNSHSTRHAKSESAAQESRRSNNEGKPPKPKGHKINKI